MDDQRLKEIDAAVTCTLTKLGFDLSDPIEVQSDMHFLRSLRRRTEAAGNRAIMVMVGLLTVGLVGGAILALGRAIKEAIT